MIAGALVALAILLRIAHASAAADEISVPVVLQAKLLSRVVEYDRGFVKRAGDRAHVLLLMKAGNPDSVQIVTQMRTELKRIERLGSLPHDETVVAYTNAADLVKFCKAQHIAVVYLGSGFRDDLGKIREGLSTLDILSVASVGDYVFSGMVLGFDVVSSRPRMVINLPQARVQHVDFSSEALKLMTVVR